MTSCASGWKTSGRRRTRSRKGSQLVLTVGFVFNGIDLNLANPNLKPKANGEAEEINITYMLLIGLAIAAILALRPKILLLDEPTGELDPAVSEQIFRILREMNERFGMTVIVVEQKIMLLSSYAKTLAVLNDGQLEVAGPVREVLKESRRLEEIGVNCPARRRYTT